MPANQYQKYIYTQICLLLKNDLIFHLFFFLNAVDVKKNIKNTIDIDKV